MVEGWGALALAAGAPRPVFEISNRMCYSMTSVRGRLAILLTLVAAAGLSACNSLLGDDPTPRTVRFEVLGGAGADVEIIVSREFIAATTETGVTQVEVFLSDTVLTALPYEQELDVSLQRHFFVQVTPTDTLDIPDARVIVSINGEERFNDSGVLPVDPPFRYVYVYNQRVTRVIEVF